MWRRCFFLGGKNGGCVEDGKMSMGRIIIGKLTWEAPAGVVVRRTGFDLFACKTIMADGGVG